MTKIQVTEDDINQGQPREERYCPVALAMSRALGAEDVLVGYAEAYVGDKCYAIPELTGGWIEDYDEWGEGSPFEFELGEPYDLHPPDDRCTCGCDG